MKKFLKVVGIIVLLLIVFVLVAGLILPKKYHLERYTTINAPREKVWNNVNSLPAIDKWSPFSKKDPNIQKSFEGQQGTVGSVYNWKGNKDVGQGSQTLTELQPTSRVGTRLHFIKPFEGKADAFINLSDTTGATKVVWGFDSEYPYPMNVMQLFGMDKMMNKEYDAGLSMLKQLSEQN